MSLYVLVTGVRKLLLVLFLVNGPQAPLFGVSRSIRPDGAFDSEVISAVSWHHTAIQGS
jgi:hypothetical protein